MPQLMRFICQSLQCLVEQGYCPAPFIQPLRSNIVSWIEQISSFRFVQIERYEDSTPSALYRRLAIALVRNKVSESRQQECSESASFAVEVLT